MTPKLTLPDRFRSWLSSDYAVRALRNRTIAQATTRSYRNSARRHADNTRTDIGWSQQPFGPTGTRTLTPQKRRNMVRRSRQIDENNILGASLMDRAVDNIIGEHMVLRATTRSKRFNERVQKLWEDWNPDIRKMMSFGDLQRSWYRARLRDGDVGLVLLRTGDVQTIESDYIQSPFGESSDQFNRQGVLNIIEGVEINGPGRPTRFHVVTDFSKSRVSTTAISQRDFVWYIRNERNNREAVRGVPLMAELGWMLEQIDGTVEATVMAYRMAAAFGLLVKKNSPGQTYDALPDSTNSAEGDAMPEFEIEPAMVEFLGVDEDVVQVKPEHPASNLESFITTMIRIAGIRLGLPLELALLDFSKTNYSSARASMEQAYRHFRIEQRCFARCVLKRLYEWRVSKWIKDGELPERSDAFTHRFLGQQWPYLDPQKEAIGALIAMDSGQTTLSEELTKRNMTFEQWADTVQMETEELRRRGITRMHSTSTRSPDGPGQENSNENSDDEVPVRE